MSLNDPQWGRGGGSGEGGDGQRPQRRPDSHEGPPDLEELWHELSRRLGNLFGGGGGGGGDGGSDLWRAGLGVTVGVPEVSLPASGVGVGVAVAVRSASGMDSS